MCCEMRTLQGFMRQKTDWIKQKKYLTSVVHYLNGEKKTKLSTVRENVTKCQNQNSYKIKQNVLLEIKTAAQNQWNSISQIHEKGTPLQAAMSILINKVKQNYHIKVVMKKGTHLQLLAFAAICYCGFQKVVVGGKQRER